MIPIIPIAVKNPRNSSIDSGRISIIQTIVNKNANKPERIKHIIFIKSIILAPIVKNLLMIQKLHLDLFLYI